MINEACRCIHPWQPALPNDANGRGGLDARFASGPEPSLFESLRYSYGDR